MRGVPAVPDGSLALRVDQVFDASGELARVLDGYEPRASQRTLAVEIARAFDDGGRLLAEAGTGTGKTLAYLVPAILSGRRALISTGTKNLQEQILQKDLPILRSALDRPFKAVCMKGRGNYLCKHRWTQFREQPVIKSAADRIALTLVDEWSGTTRSGDRAEIDELPEDVSFWNDVSASTENCMGSSCQQYSECFITTMRQEAAEADLVVVNHHLLCADAAIRQHSFGEVIPECELLVIDEAHQLEDIATQYFGVGASNFRLDELVRDGERLVNQKRIGNKIQAADLRAAIVTTSLNGKAFFTDLTMRRPGQSRGPRQSDGLFDERLRLSAEVMEDVFEAGFMLVQALDQWAGAVTLVEDADEDLKALGKRAADFRDDLRFLLAANDPSFVFFLEIRGRGTYLRAMPIDVSSIVREHLLERPRAAVLTSATLCVNGEFGYVRARLGVREADEVRLPSEFDHARQSLLYLPRSMPDPRSPEFVEHAAREVVEILQRSEGRAFVLFTSYANLRDVHARIAPRLPYPMLVQGSAPRTQLVEQFRRTPNAVLLATSSFWQGVDVVGDALSCVIIDKLPFASPGDPIVQARIEAITERGGDAFHGYQVPLAILALLQGLGRLLRHREDRGVLAVLDPRLKTMGYGRRFLASLPPSPVTHRIDDIAKFFAS